MTMFKFFCKKSRSTTPPLPAPDKEATKKHEESIRSIDKAEASVHTLKQVLIQNGITLEIAKTIGHK